VSVTSGAIAGPTPSPLSTGIKTLEELQTKIRTRLSAPEVRRGRVGIKIVTLKTGKVIYENDADKYFMPASNMKNFTVSTALEKLGPDFRFVTSAYAATMPDTAGVIQGDLRILGRGDVSMSTSFDPAFPSQIDHYRALDMLVDKIAAAGVKRIEGDVVADETYFHGFALPPTWEWDDIGTYSGAEVSAFPLNDNVIDILVKAGPAIGNPCDVVVRPATQLVRVVNRCTTVTDGTPRVTVTKGIDQNVVQVSGTALSGAREVSESVTFTHMAELFVSLFKERLERKGIVTTGTARAVRDDDFRPPSSRRSPLPASAQTVEIAKLESPAFSIISGKTMKPSQNMFTETILWTLGEKIGRANGASGDSGQLGINVVKSFLTSIGIPADAVVQYDGSGLSRHDLITPNAVVALYTYMAKQSKNAQVWRDSLTIGGVDGTLRNRFRGTAAENNIRGKTGTIDQVSALSGYVTTKGGEELVVSIIVNGVPGTSGTRTALTDEIVVNLASFTGRIDP